MAKDGDAEDKEEQLGQLLKILGTPPMFTTLRVNTLRDTRVNIREHVQSQIDKVKCYCDSDFSRLNV